MPRKSKTTFLRYKFYRKISLAFRGLLSCPDVNQGRSFRAIGPLNGTKCETRRNLLKPACYATGMPSRISMGTGLPFFRAGWNFHLANAARAA